MALEKRMIKEAYPLPSYNYRVDIGEVAVGFSEVSGLSIKRETTIYKESPTAPMAGPVVMRMPAQLTPPTVTLKKGIVKGASYANLYKWINDTAINQVEKKDVYVLLCDENGNAVLRWVIVNAFPTKLDAPTFSAASNDAAIETLELMADSIRIEEAG